MAGRIRDEDIALVRERARIDEIVRDYVSLKSAGGGSLKGLCPFHEERSPSFHVTPARGMWYCFGCGEGGDVLNFLQKIDHMSFAESVEKLAGRTGVELRYVDGGAAINRQQGQRTRLVEAHKVAADFYRQQLGSPEAQTGREFLTGRGFDAEACTHFGVGYAPKGWDALTNHLRQKAFTDAELLTGGLVSQGNRGVYDRFRGRLVWPIRDLSGDVIGFGARKLYDDDDGPKYLNTPETPLYKKSQVLYGIDLARRDIAKQQQAVIVEGYTDVMACHLAGVTTAVATCGTSFGAEHIKVLRRLLMDEDQMRGHVVFTFDGDAAGQKAALRAFEEDQRFVSQTFVAVEKSGMDPCELRQAHGDAAVRELVESRSPLFEFAIRSILAAYNLETAEGRVGALQEAAPLVARIKDPSLRPEYARMLAGWLGIDVEEVRRSVERASRTKAAPARPTSGTGDSLPTPPPRPTVNARRDPGLTVEREALKAALQQPAAVSAWYESVEESSFTHPSGLAVHAAIMAAGSPSADVTGLAWVDAVLEAAHDDEVRGLVRELSVEPMPASAGQDARYAVGVIARLLEIDASRQITELKGRMQRADANSSEYQKLFAELMALTDYQRSLTQSHVDSA
ncbi:MAG: DNA primase [Candidatus Nanopelagicales bacterium]|jgi:DNA primase|nr:DNA primase [Candidatus Nanopelagicales bacterium]